MGFPGPATTAAMFKQLLELGVDSSFTVVIARPKGKDWYVELDGPARDDGQVGVYAEGHGKTLDIALRAALREMRERKSEASKG